MDKEYTPAEAKAWLAGYDAGKAFAKKEWVGLSIVSMLGLDEEIGEIYRAECDGGQCGIGGYCKKCPKTQPEPVIQARKEGDLIVVDLPQVPRGSGGISKDEQPEPEPVAVLRRVILGRGQIFWLRSSDELPNETLLYAAPPKREWVGLSDEELEFYTEESGQGELGRGVLRAVVDFLKEKNA